MYVYMSKSDAEQLPTGHRHDNFYRPAYRPAPPGPQVNTYVSLSAILGVVIR